MFGALPRTRGRRIRVRNNSLYCFTGALRACVPVCVGKPTHPSSLTPLDDTSQNFACRVNESFAGMSSPASSPYCLLAIPPDDNYVGSASHPPPPKPLACLDVATATTAMVGTLLQLCDVYGLISLSRR